MADFLGLECFILSHTATAESKNPKIEGLTPEFFCFEILKHRTNALQQLLDD